MKKPLNIVIACGGTGGHLFPGIAVAQTLKKRGHNVTLLISMKDVDAEASAKYKGDIKFIPIQAIAKPPLLSLQFPKFLSKLYKTVNDCKAILQECQADVVLGMGGFTTLAPVYAAKKLHIPALIHDSNALPGKANKLAARWCSCVLLGVSEAAVKFKPRKTITTGTPVRSELRQELTQKAAIEKLNSLLNPEEKITPEAPIIMSMGGSQGAVKMNTLIAEAAKMFKNDPLQFIIIAGKKDFERVQKLCAGYPKIHVLPFCNEMGAVYKASSFAICRSGASTLTELAYFGLPSLLIPFPFAAEDHQTINASIFNRQDAAYVFQQKDLDPDQIYQTLYSFFSSREKQQDMYMACKNNAVLDADERIADALEKTVYSGKKS